MQGKFKRKMKREDKRCFVVQDILLNLYLFISFTLWATVQSMSTCIRERTTVKAVPYMHILGWSAKKFLLYASSSHPCSQIPGAMRPGTVLHSSYEAGQKHMTLNLTSGGD